MNTVTKEIDLELIRQAQVGRPECTSRLTEMAREKVFVYIYRLTFDHDLAQDLTQDTMVEILRSLSRLRLDSVACFWAWTYKTALSKVRRHFRPRRANRPSVRTGIDLDAMARSVPADVPDQAHDLMRKELLNAVVKAMHALRLEYRNILTLRCMDGLSYAEIASIEGGTELGARLRFFKARNALRRTLSHRGFDGSYLAPGLGLLAAATAGRVTGSAAAAAAVSATSIQVSPLIAAIGVLVSKWTASLVGVIVVALALGPVVWSPGAPKQQTDLCSLVKSGGFALPSAISGLGPQQGGFVRFQAWPADPQAHLDLSPEQWLESMAADKEARAFLKPGSWIELRFPGPIADGPGPDIFLAAGGCKGIEVFVGDGRTRLHRLAVQPCSMRHDAVETLAYDLAGVNIPFEICAIRIVATERVAPLLFELAIPCARTKAD